MNDAVMRPPRAELAAAPAVSNRRESPILPAGLTDEEVVSRWLQAKGTGRGRLSPTTLAQYRTEAERLFWYVRRVGRELSTWTIDEFSAYVSFLSKPEPWAIRARGVRRGTPEWRPFLGPLSDASAGQSQKIVTSLLGWMRDAGHLAANPASGLPTVGRSRTEKQARFLPPVDTALIREAIAARREPSTEARLMKARDRFALDLFEYVGLRTIEAIRGQMNDVQVLPLPEELRTEHPDAPPFQWLLRVKRGKGGKARWVPCDEIAVTFQTYRVAFGLPPIPASDDTRPLLMSVRRARPEGEILRQRKGFGGKKENRSGIWKLIRRLCLEAQEWATCQGRHHDAARLKAASTHWLRHSYAKGLAAAVSHGLDPRAALENMGHDDLRTFNQYVDDEPAKRAFATAIARKAAAHKSAT